MPIQTCSANLWKPLKSYSRVGLCCDLMLLDELNRFGTACKCPRFISTLRTFVDAVCRCQHWLSNAVNRFWLRRGICCSCWQTADSRGNLQKNFCFWLRLFFTRFFPSYYLYQRCTVKQMSDNEIYLLIKYIKSVLWRAAKRLSCIQDALCLKVNIGLSCIDRRHFICPSSRKWAMWYKLPDFVFCREGLYCISTQCVVYHFVYCSVRLHYS